MGLVKSEFLVIVMLWVGLSFHLHATPTEWKLKKSRNNVQLYTAVDEHRQKWVKAVTQVETPWWSLLNLLRETDSGPEWIDSALEVTLLQQPDEFTDIVRTRFSAPLMFQNREMYTQSLVTYDHEQHMLIISVRQHQQLAVSKGYTQMENIQGQWLVVQLPNGISKITWTGTGVAGGNIPDWLAANVMVRSTFKTFEALNTRLLEEKYHVKPLGYLLSLKNP